MAFVRTDDPSISIRRSAGGSVAEVRRGWIASGYASESAAFDAVALLAPSSQEGLNLQSWESEDLNGVSLWRFRAIYSRVNRAGGGVVAIPQTGQAPRVEFGTLDMSVRLTQSYFTPYANAQPGNGVPAFNGLIDVTESGAQGIDVPVGGIGYMRVTKWLPPTTASAAFRKNAILARGKVNQDAFAGYQPGEVLLRDVVFRPRAEVGDWEVESTFWISYNATDLEVPGIEDLIPAKLGWDYLWKYYVTEPDEDAGIVVPVPLAVFVEEVYPRVNMTGLGLGPTP